MKERSVRGFSPLLHAPSHGVGAELSHDGEWHLHIVSFSILAAQHVDAEMCARC